MNIENPFKNRSGSTTGYWNRVWKARYVWTHLAIADMRTKYRRSVLGILWALLFPLLLTMLLTLVMGGIFKVPLGDYALYVFSGLVVWEFFCNGILTGCHAFINGEGYIKQFNLPVVVYPLRSTLTVFFNFLLAFLGLLAWCLIVRPNVVGWSWFFLPLSFLLMFFAVWPLAVLAAFIGVQFRDSYQLMVLALQALWYVSPVFVQEKYLRQVKYANVVDFNPIYHLLQLLRAPMLDGQWPTGVNVFVVFGFGLGAWTLAWVTLLSRERRLIYYF